MATEELGTPAFTADEKALNHIKIARSLNRRRFMAGLGLGTAAVAGAGILTGCGDGSPTVVSAAGVPEADVLNFALNLEYFEATLYSYLVTGADIPSGSGGGSGVTGAPAQISATPLINDLLAEIYFDELSHVNDLRTLLGSAAVARPALDLSAVTPSNYLSLSRLIEDVGVTAYVGAATLLTSNNLQYAAQILAVEAFHSGALRLLSIQNATTSATPPSDGLDVKPADPGSVTAAKAGPTTSGGGFFATAGATPATQTPATYPGMAYRRSTSQVLAIVYGNTTSGTARGGFFPAGLNGAIKTV